MRIFSVKDYAENTIPDRKDFKPAVAQFEKDCITDFLGKEVKGYFKYGSVNRDDFTVASDVDCLMVTRDDSHDFVIANAAISAKRNYHVEIQTRVILERAAAEGIHGIDASFQQHLELSLKKYGYQGGNPLAFLKKNSQSFQDSLCAAICGYSKKLRDGRTNCLSEESHLSFLKAIMEKPFHAMRVAIQYELGSVASTEDFEDTKTALINMYKTLDRPHLLEPIEKLCRIGRNYVALLEGRKTGFNIPDLYDKTLRNIENCYHDAYYFIEQNALLMR